MPFSRLFRSRWSALLWAAGVIWFAIDVADRETAETPVVNASDIPELVNAGF